MIEICGSPATVAMTGITTGNGGYMNIILASCLTTIMATLTTPTDIGMIKTGW
jgi:hypothetical protein